MMLPSPRIVVIDDEEKDVQAIVEALTTLETSAVGIHYTPGRELPRFPCLRILFLDLHLLPGAGSTEQQVKYAVDLLPRLLTLSNGPYAIVLWSRHATEKDLFEKILQERLPTLEITTPLMVVSLDKVDHLQDHQVSNPVGLRDSVLNTIRKSPQLAALLAWEEHVAQAVNDTICQIFQMARQDSSEPVTAGLNRILGELAVSAAGIENARRDVFRSVNEVLVQIVSDRLLHRGVGTELRQQWSDAVTVEAHDSKLTDHQSTRLNSLLHLESGELLATIEARDRGSVVDLSNIPPEEDFQEIWGYSRQQLLEAFKLPSQPCRWVMVQVQPPCDQAQRRQGLLPYILGAEVTPTNTWYKERNRQPCFWLSPKFLKEDGEIRCLAFHLRFVAGFPRTRLKSFNLPVCYRLREPLMAMLAHTLHGYGGRPGIISWPRE